MNPTTVSGNTGTHPYYRHFMFKQTKKNLGNVLDLDSIYLDMKNMTGFPSPPRKLAHIKNNKGILSQYDV